MGDRGGEGGEGGLEGGEGGGEGAEHLLLCKRRGKVGGLEFRNGNRSSCHRRKSSRRCGYWPNPVLENI